MAQKFKFFEKHPELYEQGFDYKEVDQQVNFLDKIFSKYNARSVLDIACGHTPQGRKLAKKGYKISGIDLSGSLLKLASKRAQEEGVKINLHKKDMRKFKIGKFDAAYILFSSILHLNKEKDLVSHFKSVNNNLKKDGLYIIDLSSMPFDSPDKMAKFSVKKGDLTTNMIYSPSKTSKYQAKFTCISLLENKKINENFSIVLRYLPLTLLKKLANQTGFEIKELYKDFHRTKELSKKKLEYIAVLRKIK